MHPTKTRERSIPEATTVHLVTVQVIVAHDRFYVSLIQYGRIYVSIANKPSRFSLWAIVEDLQLNNIRSVVVFGATGACGQAVIERGLNNGYALTAFVRNRKKADQLFGKERTGLQIIEGDINDAAQIRRVMDGQSAAISCLASFEAPHNSMSKLTKHIVQSVNELEYSDFRYITYSLCGVRENGDWVSHTIQNVLKVFSPNKFGPAIEDHRKVIEILESSSLDYTLFQTATMVNKPMGAPYISGDQESCSGVRLWDRWGLLDAAEVCIQALEKTSMRSLQIRYL